MYKNNFYFFNHNIELNIQQRAESIILILDVVNEYFGSNEFSIYDQFYSIENKSLLQKVISDHLKAPIIKQLGVKELSNTYIDKVGSTLTISNDLLKIKTIVGSLSNKIPNCIIIEQQNITLINQEKLFVQLIQLLNPIWASITRYEIYNDLMKQSTEEIRVGYLTYLSKAFQTPILPSNFEIRDVYEKGKIIYLITSPPFDESNKEYLSGVKTLVDLFRQNNIVWR